MKKLILVLTIALVIFMGYQNYQVSTSGYSLLYFQFSSSAPGFEAVKALNANAYGDGTLLDIAISNTRWDYLFIFLYVVLIMTWSNALMQKQKQLRLNEFLRLNLMLIVLTGVFDMIENTILLHNFRFPLGEEMFIPVFVFSGVKWILTFWIIGVLIVSKIKS